jgi:hypothetical protein
MKIIPSFILSALLCLAITASATAKTHGSNDKARHSKQKNIPASKLDQRNRKKQFSTPSNTIKPVMDVKKIIPQSHIG